MVLSQCELWLHLLCQVGSDCLRVSGVSRTKEDSGFEDFEPGQKGEMPS